MKTNMNRFGVINPTVEEVVEIFEDCLPHKLSGYIRSLRPGEIILTEDTDGRFGYFSSIGEFISYSDEKRDLWDAVVSKGLNVHQVH